MAKIHGSLDGLRYRLYSLRYGEEEAGKLLALKGKARAKRLAMLDAYDEKEATRREYEKLRDDAHDAKVQRVEEENTLAALEFKAAHFQIEIDAALTDKEREVFRPKLDLNSKRMKDCRRRLQQAQFVEEALAKQLKARKPPKKDELPQEEPESPPPRTLPLDEVRATAVAKELSNGLHAGMERFYEKVFGRRSYREILSLDLPGRLQAVQDLDLAKVGKHKDLGIYLIIAREAAVEIITTKNSILSMVNYALAVIDDIPQSTNDPELQEKAEKGKRILEELEPLLAEATGRVEECKDVVYILECRVRDEIER